MKYAIRIAVIALAVAAWGSPMAFADPDKDDKDGGKSLQKYYASEQQEKYRQNNCEIKLNWEKEGKYKKEIECPKGEHSPAPTDVQPLARIE